VTGVALDGGSGTQRFRAHANLHNLRWIYRHPVVFSRHELQVRMYRLAGKIAKDFDRRRVRAPPSRKRHLKAIIAATIALSRAPDNGTLELRTRWVAFR
jgi:hypothetical protein